MSVLPLGIVIPCKNSTAYLPRHLEHLNKWAGLAEEIVVVDSYSKDGSLEYLKAQVKHARVQFLSHPPGLYKSWNFGIENVSAKYVHISTVGDTITPEGIAHLVETAETCNADVVVSKPTFLKEDGGPADDVSWPVDDVLATRQITRPRLLHPVEVLLFTATHLDGTMLGSCGSNIFRTATLKKFPFSSDFGKAGDAAWAAMHFADVKWAVTPEKMSTFLWHPNFASPAEIESLKNAERLDRVLRAALESPGNGNLKAAYLEAFRASELCQAASGWLEHKRRFDRARSAAWPWILNPVAWKDRVLRNRHRKQCQRLRDHALALLDAESRD